jgi:multidrug resistance protein, MATE family
MINTQLNRQILHLALPMMLSNITTPLLGLVDTAILGHLDSPKILAGVALGSMVITMIGWTFGFLRMGTSGKVAQAYGANDQDEIVKLLIQSSLIAVFLSALLLLFRAQISEMAFYFTQSQDTIKPIANEYFSIRVWALPATFLNSVLLGWFLGVQYAKAPLILLVSINLINIFLDFVFIIGLDMGAVGAAWASLISEYSGLMIGFVLLRKNIFRFVTHFKVPDFPLRGIKQLLSINSDILIRTLSLQLVFYIFTIQGTQFGSVVFAANAVLMNFLLVVSNALDGVAHATEALIGEAVGKKSPKQFQNVVKSTFCWTAIFAVLLTLIFYLFGSQIIHLLTDIESVRKQADTFLVYMVLLPIIGTWSYWLDGLFIGANQSKMMRNTMLAAALFGFLPLWWWLLPMLNHGLWIAFLGFMLARAILMGGVFHRYQTSMIER